VVMHDKPTGPREWLGKVTGTARRHPLAAGISAAAVITLAVTATVAATTLGSQSRNGTTEAAPAAPTSSPAPSPDLRGAVVKVSLTDSGGPMGEGTGPMHAGAMGLSTNKAAVPRGTVSFLVTNAGSVNHEMAILPLAGSQPVGARPFGGDATVDEAGILGEASKSGGAGDGEGIVPQTSSWVTVTLSPGRYELICNLGGHYVSGMYRELTVT
jgi:uncharacterized cupredoxin-like copper-binding protein